MEKSRRAQEKFEGGISWLMCGKVSLVWKDVCESAKEGLVSPLSFPEARPLPGLGDLSRPMGQSF